MLAYGKKKFITNNKNGRGKNNNCPDFFSNSIFCKHVNDSHEMEQMMRNRYSHRECCSTLKHISWNCFREKEMARIIELLSNGIIKANANNQSKYLSTAHTHTNYLSIISEKLYSNIFTIYKCFV